MDRGIYFGKCLAMLNTEHVVQLQKDLKSYLEENVQRNLRKIKNRTAKVHKLSINDIVEEIPLSPIASDLYTALYQLARYLINTLSTLSCS